MIHLLTIRRPFPKKNICTDHNFYLLPYAAVIKEWRTCYQLETMELQPHLCRWGKESPANDFVINLAEMINHPGIIYENLDAIRWYADAILAEEL